MISAKKLIYQAVTKLLALEQVSTAYPSSPFTPVALATTEKKISLSSVVQTANAGLSISDGGVKIPADGKYLISTEWYFNTLGGSANSISVAIKRNSTELNSAGSTHTGGYFHTTIAPILYSLTANDVLYLYAKNNTSAVGQCSWASITIERVE